MRRMTLLVMTMLAGLVGGPAMAGCGAGLGGDARGACTLIGCADGITIHLDELLPSATTPLTVTTCVAGDCRDTEFDASAGLAPMLIEDRPRLREGSMRPRVSVRVLDRDGRVVADHEEHVRLEESQPNGPRCPPVCVTGSVRVEAVST